MIDPNDPRLKKVAYAKIVGEGIDVYVRKFEIFLGRTTKSMPLDVVLGNNMNISRQHAKIVFNFETKNFELIVMGKNGCTVNGTLYTPVSPPQPLCSQDLMSIADRSFHFLLPRAEEHGARRPQPPLPRAVVKRPADDPASAAARSAPVSPIKKLKVEGGPFESADPTPQWSAGSGNPPAAAAARKATETASADTSDRDFATRPTKTQPRQPPSQQQHVPTPSVSPPGIDPVGALMGMPPGLPLAQQQARVASFIQQQQPSAAMLQLAAQQQEQHPAGTNGNAALKNALAAGHQPQAGSAAAGHIGTLQQPAGMQALMQQMQAVQQQQQQQ